MIKIEFTGTGEEVRNEMLRLLGLSESKDPVESNTLSENQPVTSVQPHSTTTKTSRKNKKTTSTNSATWTEEAVNRLFKEIKPNAQKILAELAKRPEGYPRKELAQTLGLEEQSIRGQLSSVGAALRRMERQSSPISKSLKNGEFKYKLDSTVAAIIMQRSN